MAGLSGDLSFGFSGCFRLERLPGGPCTHWKAPPFHGAHHLRTRSRTMMRKGVPLRAHSCPYLSLDRGRSRLFLRGKSERAAWTNVPFCAIDRGGVSPVKTTGVDGISGPSCEGGRFSRLLQTVGDRLNTTV